MSFSILPLQPTLICFVRIWNRNEEKNTEVYPSPIEAFCRGNFIIDCVVTFDQMFDCIIHMQSSIVNVDVLVSLTELFHLSLKYILYKQEP